jgi:hypothetical protein
VAKAAEKKKREKEKELKAAAAPDEDVRADSVDKGVGAKIVEGEDGEEDDDFDSDDEDIQVRTIVALNSYFAHWFATSVGSRRD